MCCTYFVLPIMIATTVFANPLLHDRIDVIRTTSSLKKRFDGFGLDDDVSNNDKVLADIVSQNMIPNSNTNSIDLSDLAVDDTTTSININEPIADCISEDTPNIDQDPTQKRSTPKAVCPARENTQAPRASLFNFKNFNPFKKPDSNTQRKTRPGENPCTGPSLSLDGLSQSVHVSCGGPKVGVMGIRCDYVLNCMPGRSIFPVLTLNQKTYLYMTGVVSSIGDRTVFDPTIQTLQFCCHKHYDEPVYYYGKECYQLNAVGRELGVTMMEWTHTQLAEHEEITKNLLREQGFDPQDEWFIGQ